MILGSFINYPITAQISSLIIPVSLKMPGKLPSLCRKSPFPCIINTEMPLYVYEAADSAGKKTKAQAEAADEKSLRESLRKNGLIPIRIKPFEQKKSFSLNRVTKKDLFNFTSELGSLLEAGLPIDRAIFILSENSRKEEMKKILKEICVDIQKGQALSQAMARHKLFPKVYVNMIKAGEAGGILEQVIKRLSDFLETTLSFRDEIVSAMLYPALIVVMGCAVVLFLVLFVVPQFAPIFEEMGATLPAPTLVLMAMSNFAIHYWWAGLLALVATGGLFVTYARTREGRIFKDSLKLKIPFIRKLHLKFAVARFSRTLGTLMQSGVPILQAMKISREVLGNELMSNNMKQVEEGIQKGRGVAIPLKETGVFPDTVGEMISVGEEAGRLEETFLKIAGRFESESRASLKRITNLMGPVFIIIMAVIVGFVVISILLAVFSINDIPL